MQRRKKLRTVCFEELPWRCQMNLISAECHYQICLTSFDNIAKQHGCPDLQMQECMMDMNWFTLSTSGTLIVSWPGCTKTYEKSIEKAVDIGGETIEHKPEIHIVPSASKLTLNVKVEKKGLSSLGKYSSLHQTEEQKKEEVVKHFIRHLEQIYLHYHRALVLSHRGRNWVLLQQACNNLFNMTHTLMMKIMLLNTNIDTTTYKIPYKLSKLRSTIYKTFYMAAEFLLECMSNIEIQWAPGSELSMFGNIHENRGGCNLVYDYLDCNSYIDYGNIKRVVMFAIEVLFYEQKWERVISIIMKLNSLSLDHFSESLLPLLVVAQRYLLQRLSSDESNFDMHPSIIFDKHSGVPLDINLLPVPNMPIEVGAHIDPVGHNLYDIPVDGSKYSIVPIQYEDTQAKLIQILHGKSLASRMLEHSRKLSIAYLAGKQGKKYVDGKMQRIASAVSFIATQVKAPSPVPVDYNNELLELVEDVETHALSSNFLSIVVTSYQNTLELLKEFQQSDLEAQAMHELGNIMFHSNNLKAAFKWWSCALDSILKVSNGLKVWRSIIDFPNPTLNGYKPLLNKCGIWGCLLGGLLSTKIARYIHYSNVAMCSDACHLAAAFFKALFCASLVHPSSYHSYCDYDIGVNNFITEIISGLNLFSDDNRIHCSNLVDSAIWLTEHLLKLGYYVEIQPLLTFCQYLSSTICKDISSVVKVKLLRIDSLCHLNMFGHAIKYFAHVISATDMPSITESVKLKIRRKWKTFDDSLSVFDQCNVKAVDELGTITLKDIHYNIYGSYLCNMILYMQANLLVSIAANIYELPVDVPSLKDGDIPRNRKSSQLFQIVTKFNAEETSKEKQDEKKVDCSIEDLLTPGNLKGRLLYLGQNIIEGILNSSSIASESKSIVQDLESYVKCRLLLSRIAYEKLLVLSAAHHAHSCLQAISNMVIPDNAEKKVEYFLSVSCEGELTENGGDAITIGDNVDVYLWLSCRQILCYFLLNEDNAVGRLAGPCHSLVGRIGSIEQNLDQAITECDIFNYSTSKLFFQKMYVDIDVKRGKETEDILNSLKNLEEEINMMSEKSYPAKHLLIEIKKLAADLKALEEADLKKTIIDYNHIELLILNEIIFHGYDVDMNTKFPVIQYMNFNCSLVEDLICTKVSIHRSNVLATASLQSVCTSDWIQIVSEIDKLLAVAEKMTMKLTLMKIEMLILKGEIQRILVRLDNCKLNVCVKTLLEVINLSNTYTRDLSIIRQCYLEIAMVILSQLKTKEMELTKKAAAEIVIESQSKPKGKVSQQMSKVQRKLHSSEKATSKEVQRLVKAAWICIRAAGVIAKAQQKSDLLTGEVSITSEPIIEETAKKLPVFALEDMLGVENSNRVTLSDHGYQVGSHDDEENKKLVELTWVHILNYARHIRCNCNYSSLAIGANKITIVHIPQKCHVRAIKLSEICKYLASHSTVYKTHCLPSLPMETILAILKPVQTITKSDTAVDRTVKDEKRSSSERSVESHTEIPTSYSAPGKIPSHMEAILSQENVSTEIDVRRTSKAIIVPEKSDKTANNLDFMEIPERAKEYEVAIQWYLPELETPDYKIQLLVALNSKSVSISSISPVFSQAVSVRQFTIDLKEVLSLHERLVQLMEVEEAVLALQGQRTHSMLSIATTCPPSSPSRGPSKKIKPTSPTKVGSSLKSTVSKVQYLTPSFTKSEKDSELKNKLSGIASTLNQLLGNGSYMEEADKVSITFDANWSNIVCLESWLNPSFGHIARTTETFFNWLHDMFVTSSL